MTMPLSSKISQSPPRLKHEREILKMRSFTRQGVRGRHDESFSNVDLNECLSENVCRLLRPYRLKESLD